MFIKARAGKKKWLTDPVELISFLKTNDVVPVQQVNEPPQTLIKPEVQEIPAPKKVSAPIGQINTETLSIKKMMEKIEEQNGIENDVSKLPRQEFTLDELKMLWKRFAFEAKEKGMETLYNALVKRDPIQLDATNFQLMVDNKVQVDYINPYLPDMIGRFRKDLQNYLLEITIIMSENNDEEEVKFLSGKDKFASLARKNPNLHTLKNTFNLDIDF